MMCHVCCIFPLMVCSCPTSMTRAEAIQMMAEHLGADLGDTWKEVMIQKVDMHNLAT
jgi:hypothetical protein